MNYELLGNQVPHLHWHLFPRYAHDPDVLKPVWLALDRAERDAEQRRRMETGPRDHAATAEEIRRRLHFWAHPPYDLSFANRHARQPARPLAGQLRGRPAAPLAAPRPVELILIETSGDVVRDLPLSQIGGDGVFTKEIHRALLADAVDVAVHSLKDLPTTPVAGLTLAAVPERGPAGDVLVSRPPRPFRRPAAWGRRCHEQPAAAGRRCTAGRT